MGGWLLCHSRSNEDVDWEKDLGRMEGGGRAKRALDPGCGSDIREEREKAGGLGWRSSDYTATQTRPGCRGANSKGVQSGRSVMESGPSSSTTTGLAGAAWDSRRVLGGNAALWIPRGLSQALSDPHSSQQGNLRDDLQGSCSPLVTPRRRTDAQGEASPGSQGSHFPPKVETWRRELVGHKQAPVAILGL